MIYSHFTDEKTEAQRGKWFGKFTQVEGFMPEFEPRSFWLQSWRLFCLQDSQ